MQSFRRYLRTPLLRSILYELFVEFTLPFRGGSRYDANAQLQWYCDKSIVDVLYMYLNT